METITILQITGFICCFILLFVFIAKYHAALDEEADLADQVAGLDEETVSPQGPSFAPRASLLQAAQGPAALEVADLKEKVKELHYRLEELKAINQKRESDMAAQLARLEARMGTFEQEFGTKLQPMLLRVIEDLEHIKGTAEPEELVKTKEESVADTAAQPADTSAVAAPETDPETVTEPFAETEPEEPASKSIVPELPEEELKF